MRTWGGAGVSVLVCTRGAAFEMDGLAKVWGVSVAMILRYYTHFSPCLHTLHVLIWYT